MFLALIFSSWNNKTNINLTKNRNYFAKAESDSNTWASLFNYCRIPFLLRMITPGWWSTLCDSINRHTAHHEVIVHPRQAITAHDNWTSSVIFAICCLHVYVLQSETHNDGDVTLHDWNEYNIAATSNEIDWMLYCLVRPFLKLVE
jgi:hypothetical protein